MIIAPALKYTEQHEWVEESNESAKIGITDFAQSELGDIVYIELPSVGKRVEKGEVLAVVESTKAASDIYAPISGTVIAVNEILRSTPEKINSEPYSGGWMVTIEPINRAELGALLSAEQYQALIGE